MFFFLYVCTVWLGGSPELLLTLILVFALFFKFSFLFVCGWTPPCLNTAACRVYFNATPFLLFTKVQINHAMDRKDRTTHWRTETNSLYFLSRNCIIQKWCWNMIFDIFNRLGYIALFLSFRCWYGLSGVCNWSDWGEQDAILQLSSPRLEEYSF